MCTFIQNLIMCGDGTIRNQQLNYCMTSKFVRWGWFLSTGTYQNIESLPCEMSGKNGIPKTQKWKFDKGTKFVDRDGITQVAHQIQSEAHGTVSSFIVFLHSLTQ